VPYNPQSGVIVHNQIKTGNGEDLRE